MDVLGIFRDKLKFIQWFYERASEPFRTAKRQIEHREGAFHEDPPGFDPENGEPPYIEEWVESDTALNVLGQSCLCLIQTSFRDFLDAFIDRSGRQPPSIKGNWFKKYAKFFKATYGIDWNKAPVDLTLIEDVSLTRNSIQHSEHPGRFYAVARKQTIEHRRRYPESIFADEMERTLFPAHMSKEPYKIRVTQESLYSALDAIEKFCSYLEEQINN